MSDGMGQAEQALHRLPVGIGFLLATPGATPFAPGVPTPSTANGLKRGEWDVNFVMTVSSVNAQQQAKQQRSQRQRDAQGFEAAQFGIRVVFGGVDF
jgi:hypothetical protein